MLTKKSLPKWIVVDHHHKHDILLLLSLQFTIYFCFAKLFIHVDAKN